MDFNTTTIRRRLCPDCKGKPLEYPDNFYPCPRCEGNHFVKDVMLTYRDSGNGYMTYAGEIEQPDRNEKIYQIFSQTIFNPNYLWS